MYSVETRAPTTDESLALRRIDGQTSAAIRFMYVFTLFLMLTFSGCGLLVGVFKGLILQRVLIASISGLLLGGIPTAAFWWHTRKLSASKRRSNPIVEDITVRCSEAIELIPALDDADDPTLSIDLGDGVLFLLRGQWLNDPAVFGCPGNHDPAEDLLDTFNSLPDPYSFPRTEFTLTRDPHTGSVLHISGSGHYLPPSGVEDGLRPEFPVTDSEVLLGSLTSIKEDLARHFQRTGSAQ